MAQLERELASAIEADLELPIVLKAADIVSVFRYILVECAGECDLSLCLRAENFLVLLQSDLLLNYLLIVRYWLQERR